MDRKTESSEGGRARRESERLRADAPWRHPTRLSALVWLYLGSGSERIWSGGRLVAPAPGVPEDWPYMAEDAADGLPRAASGAAETMAAALLRGLMPPARETVGGLHARDFAPPSDMPALRLPFEIGVSELAGVLVACHVMLACSPLTLEPAAARRAENRRRFARALHLSTSVIAARDAERAVRREAEMLMEGVAARSAAGPGFTDPTMAAD